MPITINSFSYYQLIYRYQQLIVILSSYYSFYQFIANISAYGNYHCTCHQTPRPSWTLLRIQHSQLDYICVFQLFQNLEIVLKEILAVSLKRVPLSL